MDNSTSLLDDPMEGALAALVISAEGPWQLERCAAHLEIVCKTLQEGGQDPMASAAETVQRFVVAADNLTRGLDRESLAGFDPLLTLLQGVARDLALAIQCPDAMRQLQQSLQQLADNWGDCLGIPSGWDWWLDYPASGFTTAVDADTSEATSSLDVQRLLSALQAASTTKLLPDSLSLEADQNREASFPSTLSERAAPRPRSLPESSTSLPKKIIPGPTAASIDDAEMREAYLEDAQRCLASMEKSVLALEDAPEQREPLKQLCRELHTLKGASGTVGLHPLAEYLHHIEDALQACCQSADVLADTEMIIECVDVVRRQMHALQGHAPAKPEAQRPAVEVAASSNEHTGTTIDEVVDRDEETIRVKASRIDRLMDMLAELIMLRNQREQRVAEQEALRGEMVRCVTRLRLIHDRLRQSAATQRTKLAEPGLAPWESLSGDSLSEVANDVLAVSRRMQELTTPIQEENHTVSRLVRQFRHELVELRRMPVAGLFRKLQRVARDAARAENKKVRMMLVGEHAGMERTMQERLYEPLLHIVRNAVSHGIESEHDRVTAGKDPMGVISLTAQGNPNLLIITIRDDGRGLDYDSLRRRGLEMGLLSPERSATRDELAQLIFHPGFSTRKEVSAISGRGVGMDVVADTLQRMGAWIEIDSHPGQGTSMRLHVPLRSVIEHAMVFRSHGQLYALPMQFIRHVGNSTRESNVEATLDGKELVKRIAFDHLLEMPRRFLESEGVFLVIGDGQLDQEGTLTIARRIGIRVDEVIGPEEVVVRSLPSLVQKHRMFSGITLAGSGDPVLMLDGTRLLDRASKLHGLPGDQLPVQTIVSPTRLPVLVVDDSFSIRRDMVRMLQSMGYRVVEAGDGVEARLLLRQHDFAMVFSDLEMPRMDGFELLQEIRRDRRTTDLPVVVASSRNESACRSRALELGAAEYLVKPVAISRLQECLQQIRQQ